MPKRQHFLKVMNVTPIKTISLAWSHERDFLLARTPGLSDPAGASDAVLDVDPVGHIVRLGLELDAGALLDLLDPLGDLGPVLGAEEQVEGVVDHPVRPQRPWQAYFWRN